MILRPFLIARRHLVGMQAMLVLMLVAHGVCAQKVVDTAQNQTPVVQSQTTGAGKGTKVLAKQTDVPSPRGAAASYTNATSITITDCPNPCPASGQAASLYPSPITVGGEVGVVQRVSVTLNGFSHAFPSDVDFLLVSPSGRKSVIMSDFGAGSPGVSNINVTLDDYSDRPVPSTVTGNTGVPFSRAAIGRRTPVQLMSSLHPRLPALSRLRSPLSMETTRMAHGIYTLSMMPTSTRAALAVAGQ